MGIITILWEKWVEFRRDFYKITLAAMIAPLMYLVVFGMGIQTISHGEPYLNFLIPGVVSLTTMNGSFNAIAQNLNVQRLYEKAFDQVMISPTPLWQFIAGQIIGGSLRGFYAGGVILVLTLPIDTGLIFNGWSFLIMFLNGAVFSAIGVVVSFLAKNHADVPRFSNYIIMPMAYLCNTFFSTEKLPGILGKFVSALPLSQTSHMIRSISAGEGLQMTGIAVLGAYLVVFTAIASWFIYKKKNRGYYYERVFVSVLPSSEFLTVDCSHKERQVRHPNSPTAQTVGLMAAAGMFFATKASLTATNLFFL
ncbi:MAG: ABC transporter permease [Blautia sp.]